MPDLSTLAKRSPGAANGGGLEQPTYSIVKGRAESPLYQNPKETDFTTAGLSLGKNTPGIMDAYQREVGLHPDRLARIFTGSSFEPYRVYKHLFAEEVHIGLRDHHGGDELFSIYPKGRGLKDEACGISEKFSDLPSEIQIRAFRPICEFCDSAGLGAIELHGEFRDESIALLEKLGFEKSPPHEDSSYRLELNDKNRRILEDGLQELESTFPINPAEEA